MAIEGLQHIGLYVNDVKRSAKFYTEVLGFEVYLETVNSAPEGDYLVCFVQKGDCRIEIVQLPEKFTREDGWVDHIALRVTDIDETIKELEAAGVEFEEGSYTIAPHVFPPKGSKWIMFRGPDGEHLELNEIL